MRQLTLFADPDDQPGAAALPEPEAGLADSGGPQFDLFSLRVLHMQRIAMAIAGGQLVDADQRLQTLEEREPGEREIAAMRARVRALVRALEDCETRPARERPEVLLAVAHGLEPATGAWEALRRTLLARVASGLQAHGGPCRTLDGQPAGYYWMRAGMMAEARASLLAALAERPCARVLYLLADACAALGQPTARGYYLEATLLDPFDPAARDVVDPAVRELADIAREEFEIEPKPAAWSAPVGVVIGALPRPRPEALAARSTAGHTPAQRDELVRAREFLAALLAAEAAQERRDAEAVVAARRTMKTLAPKLFAAYRKRHVG